MPAETPALTGSALSVCACPLGGRGATLLLAAFIFAPLRRPVGRSDILLAALCPTALPLSVAAWQFYVRR